MAETEVLYTDVVRERERADRNFVAFDKIRNVAARTLWHPETVAIMRRHLHGTSRKSDLHRLLQILGPEIPLGPNDRFTASDPLISSPKPEPCDG